MKTLQSIIHKPTRQLNLSPSKPLQMNYNQIHFTYDYDQFKFIKGNRHVDQSHVRNLINSMKIKYLQIPIDVNEKMEIIDGQHRYMAIKELQLPLFYIVRQGYGIKEMQMANATAKKWNGQNTLESQCALGNPYYIKFNQFIKDYKINILTGRILINRQTKASEFMKGDFTFTDEQYINGKIIASFLVRIKNQYKIDTMRMPLANAMSILQGKNDFDLNLFEKKLVYLHNRFFPTVTMREQMQQIEDIYNYRNQNPRNFRI